MKQTGLVMTDNNPALDALDAATAHARDLIASHGALHVTLSIDLPNATIPITAPPLPNTTAEAAFLELARDLVAFTNPEAVACLFECATANRSALEKTEKPEESSGAQDALAIYTEFNAHKAFRILSIERNDQNQISTLHQLAPDRTGFEASQMCSFTEFYPSTDLNDAEQAALENRLRLRLGDSAVDTLINHTSTTQEHDTPNENQ